MARRKAGHGSGRNDAFTQLFTALLSAEEFDPRQFIRDHPELADLLVAIERSGGEVTLELLEEHIPDEFRGDGESSDTAAQLLLVEFLEWAAEYFDGWTEPMWMTGGEPSAAKPTNKKKKTGGTATGSRKSISGRVRDKLNTPAKARSALRKAGNVPELVKVLKISGLTIVNLKYILRVHYKIVVSEVVGSGRTAGKAGARNKLGGKQQGGSSIADCVVNVFKNTAGAEKALKSAGGTSALCKELKSRVPGLRPDNLRYILIRRLKVNIAETLADRKETG